ncbi:MAG: phosphoglucosamine mutase [Candidatus Thermoplasmatota archaeon]
MLFGSSGIRGIINEKITPDLVKKIGVALGQENDEIIVGRDSRPTGDMVFSALVAGITSCGANVKNAGLIPTPTLAQATKNFDCGVMITASHNPAPYSGIKLWNPDGSSFDTEQMKDMEDKIDSKTTLPSWDEVGTGSVYQDAIEEHMEEILNLVGTTEELKVAVDCANGAGCVVTPYLLREMGCEVVTLNSQPDGTFPAHASEPVEENLTELAKLVKNSDIDLGIAHDGDADRMVAFDRTGRYLGGDELLALFADMYSNSVVVPVNSSMVIDELADEVNRSKVGDVYVSEMVKKTESDFGGEPSGTWIFPEISYGPDGIFAAALLTDLAEKIDLVQEVNELPSYPRRKDSIEVENKEEIMEKLMSSYKEVYQEKDLNFIDGIRFEDERGWGLIRASGTEPKIRMTGETKEEDHLKTLMNEMKDKIQDCMEEIK